MVKQISKYFSGKTIITFLAHPDDETLGCGGTLTRAIDDGAKVHCVIPVKRIEKQCYKALKKIGIKNIYWGNFDDNQMDKYPLLKVCKFLEKYLKNVIPDILITHHYNCANQDHRICYEASSIVTRPIKNKIQLFSCEIPSSTGYLRPTGFEPNFYISLTPKHLLTKIEALKLYETELRKDRSPIVVDMLARLRGAESGNDFAEAFVLVRGYV